MNDKYVSDILKQLCIADSLCVDLHNGNLEAAVTFMNSPNEYFFSDSPIDVIIRGNGEAVIDFLEKRLNKIPGSAP